MRTITSLREGLRSRIPASRPSSLPRLIALAIILAEPHAKDMTANELAMRAVKELYALARNPNMLTKIIWEMKQRPAMTSTLTALSQDIRDYS